MTSVQPVTKKPFQFPLDTKTDSSRVPLYGILTVNENLFVLENHREDSTRKIKDITVTVGSGKFGCLLEFCGEEALDFDADIHKLLNIVKIVADIKLERIAIEEQHDEANASQRVVACIT